MGAAQDGGIIERADWLAELSERARAQGKAERADYLLLLAWQAYDGQDISVETIQDIAGDDDVGPAAALSSRRATAC